jgi:hypothetical protein
LISLYIHEDAKADLKEIYRKAPKTAACIEVFLQEIKGNQDLLDRLTQQDYGPEGYAPFHVSGWFQQWNKGKNLWRLKLWDLESKGIKYRIIYAFIPHQRKYYVLAILSRNNFNYEENDPRTKRILDAYEAL